MVSASKLEKLFTAKKIKITPQRKVILEVIFKALDHPDVEEIYKRVNIIDNNISLATVYRTVSLFEANNLINKLEIGDGRARYEANFTTTIHHHHLIDIETGKIIEFADQELENLKKKIAKRLGYELTYHRLELYGKKLKK